MRTHIVAGGLALLTLVAANAWGQDEDVERVKVKANQITLEVPESWKSSTPSSNMRAAEFQIPAGDDAEENAELVVYYFGDPTGGTRANIQRWIDQFHEDGRKHELVQGDSRLGRYVLVDISGTYKKPDGPPVQQKTIDKPGSRVIGVVLVAEIDGEEDYYFLKLSGPDKLVAKQADALRQSIGVKADSEQPMKLEDAAD